VDGRRLLKEVRADRHAPIITDFCNKIGHLQTSAAQWTSLVMKTEIPRTPGAFASSIGPSLQVPLPAWRPID
jgi:hypothetical protein